MSSFRRLRLLRGNVLYAKRPFATALIIIALVAISLLATGCSARQADRESQSQDSEDTSSSTTVATGTEEGGPGMFEVTSSGFKDGARLPMKYVNSTVSGGQNVSIPLEWKNAPADTRSFAIAMVDIHPVANNFVHWLVVDVPANVTSLPEGASGRSIPAGSRELNTTYRRPGYGGPAAPMGTGPHDYVTTVYALSTQKLDISVETSLPEFETAIQGYVLASAKITGIFER